MAATTKAHDFDVDRKFIFTPRGTVGCTRCGHWFDERRIRNMQKKAEQSGNVPCGSASEEEKRSFLIGYGVKGEARIAVGDSAS